MSNTPLATGGKSPFRRAARKQIGADVQGAPRDHARRKNRPSHPTCAINRRSRCSRRPSQNYSEVHMSSEIGIDALEPSQSLLSENSDEDQ